MSSAAENIDPFGQPLTDPKQICLDSFDGTACCYKLLLPLRREDGTVVFDEEGLRLLKLLFLKQFGGYSTTYSDPAIQGFQEFKEKTDVDYHKVYVIYTQANEASEAYFAALETNLRAWLYEQTGLRERQICIEKSEVSIVPPNVYRTAFPDP